MDVRFRFAPLLRGGSRRGFAPLVCLMLAAGLLAGCGSPPPTPPKVEEPPKKVEAPPKKSGEEPVKKGETPPPKKTEDPPKKTEDPPVKSGKTDPPDTPKVVLPGPSKWKVVTTLDQKQRAAGLAFSVEGDLLAACGGGNTNEETRVKNPPAIRLYKTSDWSSAGDLYGHTENVVAVAFSLDKKSLVSAGGRLTRDAELKVWDLTSKLPVTQLRASGGVIGALVFDPPGNILFTAGESRLIKLWDFSAGKLPANAKPFETLTGHDQYITSLALSPDAKYLASSSADQTLRLWTVAESRLRTMLRGHTGQVNAVAFSPKGDYLASAAANGEVRIWDVVAVTDKTTLKVDPARMLLSVAFSPDGNWLAASGADGSVTIWDFANWKISETLKEHPDFVNQVVFSPDGRFLAAAGEDGRVVIWAVPK